MPKITDELLEAIQLRLFKKDLDYLRRYYSGTLGVNKAVRSIVRTFIKHKEKQANQAIDQTERALSQTIVDFNMPSLAETATPSEPSTPPSAP